MKSLKEIMNDIATLEAKGDLDVSISSISLNSMQISEGGLFIAIVGEKLDGHEYINDAINKGAIVIVHEKDLPEYKEGITYIKVADTHKAVGYIASAFYDHPSRKLKLIGVTGTNGKTTIATLLHKLFRGLGHNAGMMGTVVNKINDLEMEATRTTSDSITLNATLAQMVEAGCQYCFIEVSSHAVALKRITWFAICRWDFYQSNPRSFRFSQNYRKLSRREEKVF
jgi:UDP-N-acetylmuramoyl-L-alanyl-D-glutamate--2,6-diaminopimelate ligase